ncbi:MAG: hypothetical protein ABI620_07020 [Chloroflexota bacterium]
MSHDALETTSGRRRMLLPALVVAAVAAEAAFILWIPYLVTVDGATHVGGAAILRDVLQGAGALHLQYVQLIDFPPPNLLPEFFLGLAMLGLNPLMAEKVLQLTYVVALPLSLLYAVRSVRRDASWVAALALPMTFTLVFLFGFYDFSIGLVGFLAAAGYVWRRRGSSGVGHALRIGLLGMLLYLAHLVAFLEFALFVVAIHGWRAFLWRSAGRRRVLEELGHAAWAAAGLLPAGMLALAFMARTGTGQPSAYAPLLRQMGGVASLVLGLATFEVVEILFCVALALTLVALLADALRRRRHGRLREQDALLFYALAAAAVAVLAPIEVQSGGSYITERLVLFPVFGLGMWLAAARPRGPARSMAPAAWLAIALGLFIVRLPVELDESHVDEQYLSIAPCLAHNSTLAQVNLSSYRAGSLARTDPFTSEAGKLAALTAGHDLLSFEGLFPFFLFRNRPDHDSLASLVADGHTGAEIQDVPPHLELGSDGVPAGIPVDYVIVFGAPNATDVTLASPEWRQLTRQLASAYHLVAASEGGLVVAYERSGSIAEVEGAGRRRDVLDRACHPSGGDTGASAVEPVSTVGRPAWPATAAASEARRAWYTRSRTISGVQPLP